MKNYAKDLEKTIAINKTIVQELIQNFSGDSKTILQELNNENRILLEHLKESIRERDTLQSGSIWLPYTLFLGQMEPIIKTSYYRAIVGRSEKQGKPTNSRV